MIFYALFSTYQELCLYGKSVFFALVMLLVGNIVIAIRNAAHTRNYIIEQEELKRYIQESQDRPFDLKKNNLLKHPLIEEIYNCFFESCLLFIQKNSAFTKDGGYLSQDDINTISVKVMHLIKETCYPMEKELINLSFMKKIGILCGILGMLLSMWSYPLNLTDLNVRHLSMLILGLANALISEITHHLVKYRLYCFSKQTKSFFTQLIYATEIQYKRVHSR